MYKLLLVSDQEEVLNAFASINNWELLGFKPPHIRHDFEGTKDSLAKHHADGISLAVSPEQEELILAYLQENFPNVSIFEAGRNEEDVRKYLSELKVLLNRIHADFYNERSNTRDVLQMCRHEFFKKVINGQIKNSDDLHRNMRLGEGSGCPLAFRVLEAACAYTNNMATFDQASIDDGYLGEIREKDCYTV